jgi:hypothetical protein
MREPELPPADAAISRCPRCGGWQHADTGCPCNTGTCRECGVPTGQRTDRSAPRMYCSDRCNKRASRRAAAAPQPRNASTVGKWQDEALCTQVDPELWFPVDRAHEAQKVAAALSICGRCTVRTPCLTAGLHHTHGIWAGWDEQPRAALRKLLDSVRPQARAAIIAAAADRGPALLNTHTK